MTYKKREQIKKQEQCRHTTCFLREKTDSTKLGVKEN